MTAREAAIRAGLLVPADEARRRWREVPTLRLFPGERERFERAARERFGEPPGVHRGQRSYG